MVALFVMLCVLLVLAVVAIAIWLWLFIDIVDQVAALIRIKVEEHVAVWRIESISRMSQLEQRQARDEHRSRS
jgi:biopolymer transport protein ExbB/TolQ